jgi:uncharacterized protein (UPF0548 family)
MFLLRRPSDALLNRILADQRAAPLSYRDPGRTRRGVVRSQNPNHHHAEMGIGREVFRRTVSAVRGWAMYDLPWTRVYPADAPVRPGATLHTVIHHLGFWSVNPCRVVYVEESPGRFAFALGTLPLHSERGEERFLVEEDPATGRVRFEILGYAGPQHWMAWLGAPYVPHLQRVFGRAAIAAVRARVQRADT